MKFTTEHPFEIVSMLDDLRSDIVKAYHTDWEHYDFRTLVKCLAEQDDCLIMFRECGSELVRCEILIDETIKLLYETHYNIIKYYIDGDNTAKFYTLEFFGDGSMSLKDITDEIKITL